MFTSIGSNLTFLLVVLIVVGLVAFAQLYLVGLATRFRLRRISRTTISDLKAETLVKVIGQVRFENAPLEAPLTGECCVCYTLVIVDSSSESGGRLVDECAGVPFWVEDATGSILVDPLLFRIVPGATSVTNRHVTGPKPAPSLLRHLEEAADRGKHQGILASLRKGWSFHARQVAILEGATVTLLGYTEFRTNALGTTNKILTCPNDAALIICQCRAIRQ